MPRLMVKIPALIFALAVGPMLGAADGIAINPGLYELTSDMSDKTSQECIKFDTLNEATMLAMMEQDDVANQCDVIQSGIAGNVFSIVLECKLGDMLSMTNEMSITVDGNTMKGTGLMKIVQGETKQEMSMKMLAQRIGECRV